MTQVRQGYRDLPLPDDWLPFLAELQLHDFPGPVPRGPEIVPMVDELLALLTSRERTLLDWRWVRGETLGSTGEQLDGITRERVRQLEGRIVERFRGKPEVFVRLERWIAGRALCVAALRGSRSTLSPEATPAELWQLAVAALRAVTGRPYVTLELEHGGWVLYLDAGQSAILQRLFQTGGPARWLRAREVADALGCSLEDLKLGHGFDSRLTCTVSSLVGWSRWNNAECLEALAGYLAERGVSEWHFSQMAKAMAAVWPGRFGAITGRDVLGIVSRPGADQFRNVGRSGVWCLQAGHIPADAPLKEHAVL